jgi:lantibiotic modifying enzyme
MSSTRRQFLSQTAIVAAGVGLGPGVMPLLARQSAGPQPYLDIATRCARWIETSTQTKSAGIAWPADPLKPAAVGLDYYNGTPGVVGFMAQLAHATGDSQWRARARDGATYLAAEIEGAQDRIGDGLYTGLAGLGATFMTLDELKIGAEWNDAARKVVARLAHRAKAVGDGVEWSATNDIVSGTAGIGLFLHRAGLAWNDKAASDLAVRAGRRLLETGEPAQGGLMWFPGAGVNRNYPNFSHGTAGVAYFLATLYATTKDRPFLDGALAGAKYLNAVATRRNGSRAIFHVTGGGEDRFYLSWCHGPVGTARLFQRLYIVTGEAQWREWVDDLTSWLVNSGAPEQQSAGYWNNISQCCGNVGIGQYYIDLERHYRPSAAWKLDAMRQRVSANTMSRAKDDTAGLRWEQAENRVSPENLVAQTGFMQGAAGVGTFFLQLDAFSRRRPWLAPWPDTPWA